jgi:hypothetical protein
MSLKVGAAKVDTQMAYHALLVAEPVAYPLPTYAPQKKRNDFRELRFEIDTLLYGWDYAMFYYARPVSREQTENCALMLLMKGNFQLLDRLHDARLIDKTSMQPFADLNMKDKIVYEDNVYYKWTGFSRKQLLSEAEANERFQWLKK